MNFTIREERPEDHAGINRVNEEASGQPLEARLVDLLRTNAAVLLSLVAVTADQIVGHILFSPVQLASGEGVLEGAGLGPLSVLPDFQKMGIGSSLSKEGIRKIQQKRFPFIVVATRTIIHASALFRLHVTASRASGMFLMECS